MLGKSIFYANFNILSFSSPSYFIILTISLVKIIALASFKSVSFYSFYIVIGNFVPPDYKIPSSVALIVGSTSIGPIFAIEVPL